jgi:anti-sigma B factor antagonist
MKIEIDGDTVQISQVEELGAAYANHFRDEVRSVLTNGQRNVEVDLSATTFIDSCGLGALIAINKTAAKNQGRVRLLHPRSSVLQMLELTRMGQIFEIVKA